VRRPPFFVSQKPRTGREPPCVKTWSRISSKSSRSSGGDEDVARVDSDDLRLGVSGGALGSAVEADDAPLAVEHANQRLAQLDDGVREVALRSEQPARLVVRDRV